MSAADAKMRDRLKAFSERTNDRASVFLENVDVLRDDVGALLSLLSDTEAECDAMRQAWRSNVDELTATYSGALKAAEARVAELEAERGEAFASMRMIWTDRQLKADPAVQEQGGNT